MSYGVDTIQLHKNLRLDKRANSSNWYARLTLADGKREVKSTKTSDLETAKERALKMYYEIEARIANKLPPSTRKFKHVSEYAIHRMQEELDEGGGKQAYKDYISALRRWLIPYFGDKDVTKIDLAALTEFDKWRTTENKRKFSQSGINNHNAALNRVFDEAELRGWMTKSMRPTLLNKGRKSESRGSFTKNEYKSLYGTLRQFHMHTKNEQQAATREVLRNYVLFLANTGIRHGTEALELTWGNIDWHHNAGEQYLVVNVDGKTNKRSVVARDQVVDFLERQAQLNPNIDDTTLEELRKHAKDEAIWVDRLGKRATIHNLNRAFNALLDDRGLKTGADGRTRTLYSLRHYYATQDLQDGISTHALSRQLGNSTAMLDKHYSKYSPLINADLHSGRSKRKTAAKPKADTVGLAFEMLAAGKLNEAGVLAAVGVNRTGYVVTETIALLALQAKNDELISEATLLRLLNG